MSNDQTFIEHSEKRTLRNFCLDLLRSSGGFIATACARHASLLGVVALIGFIALTLLAAFMAPLFNWDIIPYIAVMLGVNDPSLPLTALHEQAYGAVQSATTEGRFVTLTADRPYRIAQYADPAGFGSMLPFYEIKALYIWVGALLTSWVGPVTAIHMISLFSTAAIGGLVFIALYFASALMFAPLAILALVLADFGTIARLGTPDAFAGMFVLAGLFILAQRPTAMRDLLAATCLIAAVLARPDTILLVIALQGACWLVGTRHHAPLYALLVSVPAYLIITIQSGHPGWWVHLWLTQVEYVPSVAGFKPDFSFLTYLYTVAKGLLRAIVEEPWPALVVVLCIGAWIGLHKKWFALTKPEIMVLTGLLVGFIGKFLVFPVNETRFHFAYLLAAMIIFICAAARSQKQSL